MRLLHRRIRVEYDNPVPAWYTGTIIAYDYAREDSVHVQWADDDQTEWINLEAGRWEGPLLMTEEEKEASRKRAQHAKYQKGKRKRAEA